MSVSDLHGASDKGRADEAERTQPSRQDPARPGPAGCPYEKYVVKDANASRIMLMLLRDFVDRGQAHAEMDEFKCPMIKCQERFTKPMDLISHLLRCPRLPYGEFDCLQCPDWHAFPTDEKEWSDWSEWRQPEQHAPRQKRSFSAKMKQTFSGLKRVGQHNSSRNWSVSGRSTSSVASSVSSPVSPDPDRSGAELRHSPENWVMEQYLSPELERQGDRSPVISSPTQPSNQDLFANGPQELQETSRPSELPSSSASVAIAPSVRAPPQTQYYTPMWGSDSSAMGSMRSDSQDSGRRAGFSPNSCPISPQTSIDSVPPFTAQLQIGGQVSGQFFGGSFVESPVEMEADRTTGQRSWATTATGANFATARWEFDELRPQQVKCRLASGGHSQTPAPEGVAAITGVNSWSPHDEAMFSAWLRPQVKTQRNFCDLQQKSAVESTGSLLETQQGPSHAVGDDAKWSAAADGQGPEGSFVDTAPIAYELPAELPPAELPACDYSCDQCAWQPKGKPKYFRNYLRKHKQIHKGVKVPCGFSGCASRFSRLDNRQSHMKKKHGSYEGSSGGSGGGGRVMAGSSYRSSISGKGRPHPNTAELEGSKVGKFGIIRTTTRHRKNAAGAVTEDRRTLVRGQVPRAERF